jgi:hypothetical protein
MKPSQLQQRNLLILTAARSSYFTHQGVFPNLLSTHFFFIEERVRLPLAMALLPIISDQRNKRQLENATKAQGEWEPLELFESSWTLFKKMGVTSSVKQQFDDLSQLEFSDLLDGVAIPADAKLSLFWAGLVDFLTNSWSILEEFCSTIKLNSLRMEEQDPKTHSSSGPHVTQLISWADMRLEHHFMNILIRLRAGWDKLADNVIAAYYGVPPANKWNSRLNKLERTIPTRLNERQSMFWANWIRNARSVARTDGLKDIRDYELHKIAQRARQTLGKATDSYNLDDLDKFVVFEHFRLEESLLLILAMIRTA